MQPKAYIAMLMFIKQLFFLFNIFHANEQHYIRRYIVRFIQQAVSFIQFYQYSFLHLICHKPEILPARNRSDCCLFFPRSRFNSICFSLSNYHFTESSLSPRLVLSIIFCKMPLRKLCKRIENRNPQ